MAPARVRGVEYVDGGTAVHIAGNEGEPVIITFLDTVNAFTTPVSASCVFPGSGRLRVWAVGTSGHCQRTSPGGTR